MTDRIETQGKTVDAAVSEALLQLGARRDEVEIKVLEEPKSGFMGILGGRAARVLVRKKRPGRRGGSGQDHRVKDADYQAHNLSGSGGGRGKRGGSRRKPSGGSGRSGSSGGQGEARGEARTDSRNAARDDKGGSRRGSRGRGGRGRSQEAGGRKQEQDQNRNRNQNQSQKQAPKREPQEQPVKAEKQEPSRKRAPNGRRRNERGRRGPGNLPDDGRGSPQDAPVEARKEIRQEPVRKDEPSQTREARAESRSRRREAPAPEPVAPVVSPEPKVETNVTKPAKPPKPRRAFGGLGARIKERRAAAKAEEAAKATAETTAEATSEATAEATPSAPPVAVTPVAESPAPEAPRSAEPPREAPRAYEPSAPARSDRYAAARSPRFGADAGDEMILEGIKAVEYAKPVGKVGDEELNETLTELTDGLLARAGFPCRCETHPGEYRQIRVTTDDASAGMLIGRHGQTVDAVEHMVERMASNAIDARARINLDINNYRMRREESLAERVAEAADRIGENGRAVHMEPMSARERRIVHMEAANLGGLRTFTMDGSGGKHVVIAADGENGAPEEAADVQPEYTEDNTEERNNY